MIKKSDMKEIFGVAAVLFAITAIAAAILAVVNNVTAPKIAENERIAQENAMRAVLPEADSFERLEIEMEDGSSIVGIYKAGTAGVAVKAEPNGYGGKISMIVGIDNTYKVTGIEIISQSETAGLGAKCIESEFKEQFRGKGEDIEVVKSGAKENQVDAISSATITSKAVTRGVNEAIAAVKSLRGGE